MSTYEVGIQIIEVWHVEVEAVSEVDAEAKAYDLSVEQIRRQGTMENIETDYATVVA